MYKGFLSILLNEMLVLRFSSERPFLPLVISHSHAGKMEILFLGLSSRIDQFLTLNYTEKNISPVHVKRHNVPVDLKLAFSSFTV
jgi:hypothetical protein